MIEDREPATAPWAGGCPVSWLVDDIGRFLAGDDAPAEDVTGAGRGAVGRAAHEVDDLLKSAFSAHEVVATELRFAGPDRGYRRTVFALPPTPVALMVLCLRMCDVGDDVSVLQHTAGQGTSTRSASWPFGMAVAEELTRPPERTSAVPLPEGLGES
jgi:hypothetical protein